MKNAYEKLVIHFTHMASLNREFQKNYPYFVLFYILTINFKIKLNSVAKMKKEIFLNNLTKKFIYCH